MSNFINKLSNYQTIPRKLVFDKTMSDRARFVYVYMASKPTGWDFYVKPMCEELGYSEDTLHKYINELIMHGWLTREYKRVGSGNFGPAIYTLMDEPIKSSSDDIDFDDAENSGTEKDRAGKSLALKEKKQEEKREDNIRVKLEDRYGDLSYVHDEIKESFFEFLSYRISIGKPYKISRCVKACYDNLVVLSGGNPEKATKIVNQSISNQWEGLFKLKDSNHYGNWNGNKKSSTEYRVNATSRFAGETSDI